MWRWSWNGHVYRTTNGHLGRLQKPPFPACRAHLLHSPPASVSSRIAGLEPPPSPPARTPRPRSLAAMLHQTPFPAATGGVRGCENARALLEKKKKTSICGPLALRSSIRQEAQPVNSHWHSWHSDVYEQAHGFARHCAPPILARLSSSTLRIWMPVFWSRRILAWTARFGRLSLGPILDVE